MDELATRVQSLPQELYDHIFNEVFTAPSEDIVTIDRSSRPPKCLQVNRRSRELFAQSYYSNTTFSISLSTWSADWLYVPSESHPLLIRELRLIHEVDQAKFHTLTATDEVKDKFCASMVGRLEGFGSKIRASAVGVDLRMVGRDFKGRHLRSGIGFGGCVSWICANRRRRHASWLSGFR